MFCRICAAIEAAIPRFARAIYGEDEDEHAEEEAELMRKAEVIRMICELQRNPIRIDLTEYPSDEDEAEQEEPGETEDEGFPEDDSD